MSHVKGIGGVFFKSKDGAALRKWYQKHLDIQSDEYGYLFKGRDYDNPDQETITVWGPFKKDSDYFDPSKREFMVNFRVSDLDGLLAKLEADGIKQVGKMEEYEYGRFAWIMDPDGTKIELWEPPPEGKKKG